MGKMPIDDVASRRWAISNVESVGMILAGRTVYDLVNVHTLRAHRMILGEAGISFKLPVSGSFTANDYEYFETREPAVFDDFSGVGARDTFASLGMYGVAYLTVWEGPAYVSPKLLSVKWSAWGLSIPGAGTGHGVTEVVYGDGNALGTVVTAPKVDIPPTPETIDVRIQITQQDEALVIKFSGDVLFDFDKADVRPDAGKALAQAGAVIRSFRPKRLDIDGHTDGKGDDAYNQGLSERRARSVANWLAAGKYLSGISVQTAGHGKKQPVAPNTLPNGADNPEGRAKNRRIEMFLIKR